MTAKTPVKPTGGVDGWAAAEVAADSYVGALTAAFGENPATIDLTDVHKRLRVAFDAVKPGLADPVIAAADSCLAAAKALPGFGDMQRRGAVTSLSRVITAIDRALGTDHDPAELDGARSALADLEAEYREQLAALESAVAIADIDSVMRLRVEVEIGLPTRIGAAKLRVLELQVERATAGQTRPQRRATIAADQVTAAEQDLTTAKQKLDDTIKNLQGAQLVRAQADMALSTAGQTVRALTAERDRLAAEAKVDNNTRLRRLAGLDDLPADEAEPEPPAIPQMLAPSRAFFTMTQNGYDIADGRPVPSRIR